MKDERIIFDIRPTFPIVWLAALAADSIAWLVLKRFARIGWTNPREILLIHSWSEVFALAAFISLFGLGPMAIYGLWRWMTTRYTLTTARIAVHLALVEFEHSIPLDKIQSVALYDGRRGDVIVTSGLSRIVLRNIDHPRRRHDQIMRAMHPDTFPNVYP